MSSRMEARFVVILSVRDVEEESSWVIMVTSGYVENVEFGKIENILGRMKVNEVTWVSDNDQAGCLSTFHHYFDSLVVL